MTTAAQITSGDGNQKVTTESRVSWGITESKTMQIPQKKDSNRAKYASTE